MTTEPDPPAKPLLDEDDQPIKPVPEQVRKAWESRRSGYDRDAYERDKAARERRDSAR